MTTKLRRRRGLRCLLGRHDNSGDLLLRLENSRWTTAVRYCLRCFRVYDAHARNK